MVGKVLYWLAVLLVSLAILVGLVLFLESRDDASLGARTQPPRAPSGLAYAGVTSSSAANTTIRSAAL